MTSNGKFCHFPSIGKKTLKINTGGNSLIENSLETLLAQALLSVEKGGFASVREVSKMG